MKIVQAINRIKKLKPHRFPDTEIIGWLSTLDATVKTEVIDTHEGGENIVFAGYDDLTPTSTELLIPAPYDEVYLFWLEAKIDYWNGEYGHYNNSISMFNAAFEAYKSQYNDTHMPKGCKTFKL
jgi:hypothetical protein